MKALRIAGLCALALTAVLTVGAWLTVDALTVTEDELSVDADGTRFVGFTTLQDRLLAHCRTAQTRPTTRGQFALQGYRRSFSYYKPRHLATRPPVLIVLHGSGGSGDQVHTLMGEHFVRLADRHGFPVIYADGLGGGWNDLRSRSPHLAKKLDLDEIAYFRELLNWAGREWNADRSRVYYFGMSNGAQMILRLLVQAPELVSAAALVGGNLPQNAAYESQYRQLQPRPVMFVNGTADNVVPYHGGEVRLLGIFDFGSVYSAEETAQRWVQAARLSGPPVTTRIDPHADATSIDLLHWSAPERPEVRAYRVNGGRHTIPLPPDGRFCNRLISDSGDMNAVDEAWDFFESQTGADASAGQRQPASPTDRP